MTPSRAVLLFKTEAGAGGHEYRREALPWWSFGIAGVFGGRLAGTAVRRSARPFSARKPAMLLALGAAAGRGCRLVRDPARQRRAGLVVPRLQPRLSTGCRGLYGWTVGRLLRVSAVVLLAYGGLLVLTCRVFQNAPTGFIPQQDQGRLIVSIQLPDSASLERTQAGGGRGGQDRPGNAGDRPRGLVRGVVVPAASQQPQLRLDVHRTRSVRQAAEARARATRPSWPACGNSGPGRSRTPW